MKYRTEYYRDKDVLSHEDWIHRIEGDAEKSGVTIGSAISDAENGNRVRFNGHVYYRRHLCITQSAKEALDSVIEHGDLSSLLEALHRLPEETAAVVIQNLVQHKDGEYVLEMED